MSAYSPQEPKPLGGYAALTAAFNGMAAAYIAGQRRSSGKVPDRLPLGDFLLLAAGTHKASRLISKDRVTSFLRSPFTRYTGEAGPAEGSQEPRGTGLRPAGGGVLMWPSCTGLWVASAFLGGYARDRDATRMAAGVFAILTASDFLHQGWIAAQEQASS